MRGYITRIEYTPDIFQGYGKSEVSETGHVEIEMQVEDLRKIQPFMEAFCSNNLVDIQISRLIIKDSG